MRARVAKAALGELGPRKKTHVRAVGLTLNP